MKTKRISLLILSVLFVTYSFVQSQKHIPLPEHPRPDFEREEWKNLNGTWEFEFDSLDVGKKQNWEKQEKAFSMKILVPFPWGSKLSGVDDEADIAWYKREIKIDKKWGKKRTFLIIGASDWETSVWIDGHFVGMHQGGYVPISFELTDFVQYGKVQKLVIRVDDTRRKFTLYGKQGYGNARGIWQTVYLEARGKDYLENVQFTPNIDSSEVTITAHLDTYASNDIEVNIAIGTGKNALRAKRTIRKNRDNTKIKVTIPDQKLWDLEDPYLYTAEIKIGDDKVKSYFGMRKISVAKLPGTDYTYVTLNNQPVYLQLTLDQSYHPDGFYTFPSDEFMKREIEMAKEIGLNGIRPHIKVEIPRKLYWADKLGMLVMADLPNSWGEPDERMQKEAEYTLREMIKRDYNHPSIFSWILFNETWGLRSKQFVNEDFKYKYLQPTKEWVVSMYYLAKSLDNTRLVEDNSVCCGVGHTKTDINSFHNYLPGYKWGEVLQNVSCNSYPGSSYLFEDGYTQGNEPIINSECGNVWGYKGSTGDVDWSWDYHCMINAFRENPQIAGWLYTEHHDVINEWNGYWRFDRTMKYTGMDHIVEGMSLNDFHSPVYISTGVDICKSVHGGQKVSVPLFISSMTGENHGEKLALDYELVLTNNIGETKSVSTGNIEIGYKPYIQKALPSLNIQMPDTSGLVVLKLILKDVKGQVLHRNFVHFVVAANNTIPNTEIVSIAPKNFTNSSWSQKQWMVLDGKKVNGAGKGHFDYVIELPGHIKKDKIKSGYFIAELSSKKLLTKDMDDKEGFVKADMGFMLGAKQKHDYNPNSYPMTDETEYPSEIEIEIHGRVVKTITLKDDPADHRGVLSWHNQPRDRTLHEAGTYGYLVKVDLPEDILQQILTESTAKITLRTKGEGGIAVYGKSFGRYAFDPSLVLKY